MSCGGVTSGNTAVLYDMDA